MLVEEALAELEQHIECLGGIAYRAPDGIALSVITGAQPAAPAYPTPCHTMAACCANAQCAQSRSSGCHQITDDRKVYYMLEWTALDHTDHRLWCKASGARLVVDIRLPSIFRAAGKGNHSVGGRPRIRPAVVRWLTEAAHRYAAAADTGSIVVQVSTLADPLLLPPCPHPLDADVAHVTRTAGRCGATTGQRGQGVTEQPPRAVSWGCGCNGGDSDGDGPGCLTVKAPAQTDVPVCNTR
jgi:hypothetical protein